MADVALTDAVLAAGAAAGIDHLGVAAVEPMVRTRHDLIDRQSRHLTAGMRFTFGNPARATDPARAVPGARSMVVGARRYAAPGRPRPGSPGGIVARYAVTPHTDALRDALRSVAAELKAGGHRARVLADDNVLVDREVARRAGLGSYGKSTNLLLGREGSWFVLGAVVTDADLVCSEPAPIESPSCGGCTRCLDGCPTGAIIEPGVVDANRCLAWLLQVPGVLDPGVREALGTRVYGCDDCQEVCPDNRHGGAIEPPPRLDLDELLELDDAELEARHGHWYIPARDLDTVRRNALVALGHSPVTSRSRATLARYLVHSNPVLRAHAVWAARRSGCHDLLVPDEHPLVLAERRAGTSS